MSWNQQQQPSWVSASTSEMSERERAFFSKVYTWMFGGLLMTAVSSLWVVSSPAMQRFVVFNPIVMIILMVAELGIVFYSTRAVQRLSPAAAATLFLVYSMLTGLTLSVVLFVYSSASIVQAFVGAAGAFAGMSVWARVTRRDLSSWGSFFYMGVIGIILASIANMFFRSTALDMAVATVGVFIFVGLTAYKTQMLRSLAQAGGPQGETYAIYGALSLYITFINLFLMLLRLFGGRRR